MPQGDHGVDPGGPSGRDIRSSEGDCEHEQSSAYQAWLDRGLDLKQLVGTESA